MDRLTAAVPDVPVYDLYDLRVTADGGLDDVTRHAVKVLAAYPDDFYFVHITDTHLPTYLYYYESGRRRPTARPASACATIINDVNIINPEFVLLTGDLVNEGELEDYLGSRYYSRAQQLLGEFQVPVFLTAGNHDIGGWDDTPPRGRHRAARLVALLRLEAARQPAAGRAGAHPGLQLRLRPGALRRPGGLRQLRRLALRASTAPRASPRPAAWLQQDLGGRRRATEALVLFTTSISRTS